MKGCVAAMDPGRLAKALKAIADEKRLLIIKLLGMRSMCVCELESLVELTQPALSHHLKILREAGVVTDTRQGKWIFYSLNQDSYTEMLNSLAALPMPATGERSLDSEINFCMKCEKRINRYELNS
jgi:ArsR family transcriptional regulator